MDNNDIYRNRKASFNLNSYFNYEDTVSVINYIRTKTIPNMEHCGVIYGENETPEGTPFDNTLQRVSYATNDISLIGCYVNFTYTILATICGRESKNLIDDGIPLTIKPRIEKYTDGSIRCVYFQLCEGIDINYREEQLKELLGE